MKKNKHRQVWDYYIWLKKVSLSHLSQLINHTRIIIFREIDMPSGCGFVPGARNTYFLESTWRRRRGSPAYGNRVSWGPSMGLLYMVGKTSLLDAFRLGRPHSIPNFVEGGMPPRVQSVQAQHLLFNRVKIQVLTGNIGIGEIQVLGSGTHPSEPRPSLKPIHRQLTSWNSSTCLGTSMGLIYKRQDEFQVLDSMKVKWNLTSNQSIP